nr:hypothetical protein [Jiangella asiatica]
MTQNGAVDFWFDPTCPWAWMTSRWILEVEKVRPIAVTWHVMSLSYLNAERDLGEDYNALMRRAWGPVRVVNAARELHGQEYVKPLYDAMGTRLHPGRRRDYDGVIAEALAEVGLPETLAAYAESDELDDTLKKATTPAWTRSAPRSARRSSPSAATRSSGRCCRPRRVARRPAGSGTACARWRRTTASSS